MIVLYLFLLCTMVLFVFALSHGYFAWQFIRHRSKKRKTRQWNQLPKVTIQLPIFNEEEHVEALLRNIVQIDYPKDRLQIQVLDDSTDETKYIVQQLVAELAGDVAIEYIHRTDRKGYKAGALKHGLQWATGDYIAIFDVDFLPSTDWLKRTLIHFYDDSIACVQTRWTFTNHDHSILTKAQSIMLNYHFMVEQNARCQANHFLHFNGTAGIWNKRAILEAGNWQGDTLTEDLDLSYRVQFAGWHINFVDEITVASELPETLPAIFSQQYRWNKGPAENNRKLWKRILGCKETVLSKILAFFHLSSTSLHLIVGFLIVLSLLMHPLSVDYSNIVFIGSIFLLQSSALVLIIAFYIAHRALGVSISRFLLNYLFFLLFTIGLTFHNAIATTQGYLGKKTSFIRTPKYRLKKQKMSLSITNIIVIIGLALSFLIELISQSVRQEYTLLAMHVFFFCGFAMFIKYIVSKA